VTVVVHGAEGMAEVHAAIIEAMRRAGESSLERALDEAVLEWTWAGIEEMRSAAVAAVDGDLAGMMRASARSAWCISIAHGLRPAVAVIDFLVRAAGVEPPPLR